MRRCPQCAEDCRSEAVVCPHCRHRFTAADGEQARREGAADLFIKALVAAVILFAFLEAVGGPQGLGELLSRAG